MNVALPKKGDILELSPDGLDDDGLATARIVVGDRRLRVHIRDAVPGDRVKARIESRFRDEVLARVVAVDEPSPDRQPEACVHRHVPAGEAPCGGCSLQAMRYDAQLRHKAQRVQRQLDGHGIMAEVLPTRAAPKTFNHRHKMELSFGRDRQDRLAVGMHPSGYRWEILTTSGCLLVSSWAAAFLPTILAAAGEAGLDAFDPRTPDAPGRVLRNLVLREGQRTPERLFELVTTPGLEREAGAALVKKLADIAGDHVTGWVWTVMVAERGKPTRHETILTIGKPTLDETLVLPNDQTLTLTVHPRAFFQPHPLAAERLIAEVVSRLGKRAREARVADLFCGTGTLGLAIAPFVGAVVGVEIVPEAIDNARENARRAGFGNVTYLVGDVAQVLADPAHDAVFRKIDIVLLDPPRAGLIGLALDAVARLAPLRIVYVSCNPTSLARDVAALGKLGYMIDGAVQPVDLFPQSPHVETVVALRRA